MKKESLETWQYKTEIFTEAGKLLRYEWTANQAAEKKT